MLSGSQSGTSRSELDPQVAATALLVEAALADGIYADIEAELIIKVIRTAFDLPPENCAAVLKAAEELAEEAVDLHRFTHPAKSLPAKTRAKLVEGLWRIVFADGEESPFEEAFVRRICPLLAVDDRTSRLARQRVMGEQSER